MFRLLQSHRLIWNMHCFCNCLKLQLLNKVVNCNYNFTILQFQDKISKTFQLTLAMKWFWKVNGEAMTTNSLSFFRQEDYNFTNMDHMKVFRKIYSNITAWGEKDKLSLRQTGKNRPLIAFLAEFAPSISDNHVDLPWWLKIQ